MELKEALKIVGRYVNEAIEKKSEDVDAFMHAKIALQKQIPESVVIYYSMRSNGITLDEDAHCPSCNALLNRSIHDWGCRYCKSCGKALNWENENYGKIH